MRFDCHYATGILFVVVCLWDSALGRTQFDHGSNWLEARGLKPDRSVHGHAGHLIARQTESSGGRNGGSANEDDDDDPQSSLVLDESLVMPGLALDGQQVPADNQVASATSTNNFINFCLTQPDLPLTNGAQIASGSCNPVPMGVIGSQSRAPTSKFISPRNLDTIKADETFTIEMKINNLDTGNFVNAQSNYFSAPQNVNSQGIIIGHSHVVIEQIDALDSTDLTDSQDFAFFKGFNAEAVNGILSAEVTGGLPAGVYKMSSINAAANHQPVLIGVAQHGSLDDAIYFTVSDRNDDLGNKADEAGGNDPGVTSAGESATARSDTNLMPEATGGRRFGRFKGNRANSRSRRTLDDASVTRPTTLIEPAATPTTRLGKRLAEMMRAEAQDLEA